MEKINYRPRPILAEEKAINPIPIPQVNHPSRKGWQNESSKAYEEVFATPLIKAPNDLAIPFPENTFGEQFKFGMKTWLLKTLFSLISLFTKERGTHQNGGVGARGTINFLQNDATEKLEFCRSAGELPITLRHSNASFEDDACGQLRAMAFRIHRSENNIDDFLLSTGAIIPFWSINSLMNFAKYRGKVKNDNWDPQKEWLQNSPTAFVAGIEAVRLAPQSYTKMSYYSAIPYGIKGTDEFVKFRVMPVDMEFESGLLTSEQQRSVWIQNRLDGNDKPLKYLANEYRERIADRLIKYTLEAQFRTLRPNYDTNEFFNLARYWDDTIYPWVSIAEMTAKEALADEATEKLAYWLGNIPKGLDFLYTYSAEDYSSIATGRIDIYPRPQKLRRKKQSKN
jgi:arachidonate 5-lipoxygenase